MSHSVIKGVLRTGFAGILLLLHEVPESSAAQAAKLFELHSGESLEKFAGRVTGAQDADDIKLTKADWNGQPFVFVEYTVSKPYPGGESLDDRVLVALEKTSDGRYRKIDVTVGEQEGGTAQVEAIAFANADNDSAKELIVLLSWRVQHYDVQGVQYEVRIFDELQADSAEKLTYLKAVSEHFKIGCECYRRDSGPEHYKFKTIAPIKQELNRMGY